MDASARQREPTTPGEILREEFLEPMDLTHRELADHLGCDLKVINRIVNGRSPISTEVALKLGATFRTTPDFWLNAQKAADLFRPARIQTELPPPLIKATSTQRPGRP